MISGPSLTNKKDMATSNIFTPIVNDPEHCRKYTQRRPVLPKKLGWESESGTLVPILQQVSWETLNKVTPRLRFLVSEKDGLAAGGL